MKIYFFNSLVAINTKWVGKREKQKYSIPLKIREAIQVKKKLWKKIINKKEKKKLVNVENITKYKQMKAQILKELKEERINKMKQYFKINAKNPHETWKEFNSLYKDKAEDIDDKIMSNFKYAKTSKEIADLINDFQTKQVDNLRKTRKNIKKNRKQKIKQQCQLKKL